MKENSQYNGSRLTAHGSPCPLISIILPVYNCEKYLPKCLNSLVDQDCPENNYEIIITDDGSTDGSGKICDEYAAKYPFIHVTHTENGGPSRARNIALTQCRGEYIAFCDGDDFVSPQLVSVLTKAIEVYESPDVLIYRHYRHPYRQNFLTGPVQSFFKRHFVNMPKTGWPVYDVNGIRASEGEYMNSENLCFRAVTSWNVGGYLWNKAIRKDLIRDITFDTELPVSEDTNFILKLTAKNNNMKIIRLNNYLYCYIKYSGSMGISHDNSRIHDDNGMSRFLLAAEKNFSAVKDVYPNVAIELKNDLYISSVDCLYNRRKAGMSRDVYNKAKSYTGAKYALNFYFRSKRAFMLKCRTLVRHIIVTLSPVKVFK